MIGTRIKELRIHRGFTQNHVCQGICSRSMLSKIENDVVVPSLDLLDHLCARLGVLTTDVISTVPKNRDAQAILDEMADLMLAKDFKQVIDFGQKALRLKFVRNVPGGNCECLRMIGTAYHNIGNYRRARVYFERAVEVAAICDSALQLASMNGLASTLIGLGEYDTAFLVLTASYELCKSVAVESRTKIRIAYNLSKVSRKLGDLARAEHFAKEGLYLSHRTGIYESVGHLESMLGLIRLDGAHRRPAMESFLRALHFYEFTNDIEGQIGSHLNLAEAHLSLHLAIEAMQHSRKALTLFRSTTDMPPYLLSLIEDTLARIESHR